MIVLLFLNSEIIKIKNMNRLITTITLGFSLLILTKINAQQWTPVASLPHREFTAIQNLDGRIYAASENKLYISADGNNWQIENIHPVIITPTCITVFNNILYVGTLSDGVYYRNLATGAQWQHALMGIHVSTFIVHDGRLHLCSQGSGVWRNISGIWNNMTYDLPTYSYNVNKIVSLNEKLYAFAGANGTFYRFNPETSKWIEDYYLNGYAPGLSADDAVTQNGVIFMTKGNRLLRSDDAGDNWVSDANGLINGINRFLYQGAQFMYSLTLDATTNYTYFQKRSNNALSQSTWNIYNELLPFYTYALVEFKDNMYVATNEGVFFKKIETLGIENPQLRSDVSIYPNPSSSGIITITSNSIIEKIEVYDLGGRLIQSQNGNSVNETLTLSSKGIYLVKLLTNNQTLTQKVIVP